VGVGGHEAGEPVVIANGMIFSYGGAGNQASWPVSG
jgi:hypothetical protein